MSEPTSTDLTVYKFPSGATFVIHPLIRSAGDGKPKPLVKRGGACKHVGAALKVKTGCSGAGRGSVWECTHPDLTGKCAPLDVLPIAEPGCVTCALCPLYEPSPEPGYVQLGLNFLSAVARWKLAGSPVRSQEQVSKLYKICQACPFMVRSKSGETACGKCGCPVNNRTDEPTKNKLALASEACPAEPPLWS